MKGNVHRKNTKQKEPKTPQLPAAGSDSDVEVDEDDYAFLQEFAGRTGFLENLDTDVLDASIKQVNKLGAGRAAELFIVGSDRSQQVFLSCPPPFPFLSKLSCSEK